MEAELAGLRQKLGAIWSHLDERTRRLTAANEAMSLGHGGVSLVQRACGLSRRAIYQGMRELEAPDRLSTGRVRRPVAGRKVLIPMQN